MARGFDGAGQAGIGGLHGDRAGSHRALRLSFRSPRGRQMCAFSTKRDRNLRRMSQNAALFPGASPINTQLSRPLLTVAIDTEEDFDWNSPTVGTSHSTDHLRHLVSAETILSAYDLVPIYLLTYPVFGDRDVIRIVRRQLEKGRCDVGIQLHPWVTPPLIDGPGSRYQSFLGNLDLGLEEKKLVACIDKFIECFAFPPRIFRAGRYGLSANTAGLLEKHGFLVDTSVAPRTSWTPEGGPDFSDYDCGLFRFGRDRDLLEIPLCRSVVGWAGRRSAALYNALSKSLRTPPYATAIATRLRCAERITLSPEGNDVPAMKRLVNALLARGHSVFPLSFHSSSLQAGRNPYVRSKYELHWFLDRLSEILHYLISECDFRAVAMRDIMDVIKN